MGVSRRTSYHYLTRGRLSILKGYRLLIYVFRLYMLETKVEAISLHCMSKHVSVSACSDEYSYTAVQYGMNEVEGHSGT